jgi:sulfur carrier protein ThiS
MDDIKQMLKEYTTYTDRIRELNTRINDALSHKIDCDTLKAQKLSGMPHGTGLSDPTYEAVQRIIDKWDKDIRDMAEEVNRLIDNKAAVDKGLKTLEWKEYRLIELHYFVGLTWERVAVETNYSIVWVWQMHGKALEKMRKEIQKSPG